MSEKLFNITPSGVSVAGPIAIGTESSKTFEINCPANFHVNTTLPDTVNFKSEWQDITQLIINGNTTTDGIYAQKVGSHVFLQGSVNVTLDGSVWPQAFIRLPENLRPLYDHYFHAFIATSNDIATVCVSRDGLVSVVSVLLYSNYSDPDRYAKVNSGTHIIGINTDYWAENGVQNQDVELTPQRSYVLYDEGIADGFRWKLNDTTAIKGLGTTNVTFNQTYADNSTVGIRLFTTSSMSNNAFATTKHFLIPQDATKLNVSARCVGTLYGYMNFAFGLVDENDTSAKSRGTGAMINFTNPSTEATTLLSSQNFDNSTTPALSQAYTTFSVDIPQNMNREIFYNAFIAMRNSGTVNNGGNYCFNKVWFT